MKLTTALRNTRATDIITAAGTNPKLKYYNGTESLTPAGTLLATLTITGNLGTATSGVIDINETVTQSNGSHVAGTPTFILITTSADAAVATLLVGTDTTFTGTVATGVDITVTAGATITEGNA
jgi:hypothetical protein